MSYDDDSMRRLQQVDPVDDELISAWSNAGAKASLLREITTMQTDTFIRQSVPAVQTMNNSTWRRPMILAAAAAFAALAFGVGSTLTGRSDPAYAISETPEGLININVLAKFRDGDALARDLRDRGIDAQVETVPASPSMIGTVELGTTDGSAAGIQTGGGDGTRDVFDWSIDPDQFRGTLLVTVFVEADNGERFGAAQEIFEPGEKLAGLQCALGEPMRASDVARYLDRVGLTPQWSIVTPTADPTITNSVDVDEVPAGIILSGYATDNTHARFDVLHDDQTLSAGTGGYISDFACTPEAASQWR